MGLVVDQSGDNANCSVANVLLPAPVIAIASPSFEVAKSFIGEVRIKFRWLSSSSMRLS